MFLRCSDWCFCGVLFGVFAVFCLLFLRCSVCYFCGVLFGIFAVFCLAFLRYVVGRFCKSKEKVMLQFDRK